MLCIQVRLARYGKGGAFNLFLDNRVVNKLNFVSSTERLLIYLILIEHIRYQISGVLTGRGSFGREKYT